MPRLRLSAVAPIPAFPKPEAQALPRPSQAREGWDGDNAGYFNATGSASNASISDLNAA
jgi:hypothetical protein